MCIYYKKLLSNLKFKNIVFILISNLLLQFVWPCYPPFGSSCTVVVHQRKRSICKFFKKSETTNEDTYLFWVNLSYIFCLVILIILLFIFDKQILMEFILSFGIAMIACQIWVGSAQITLIFSSIFIILIGAFYAYAHLRRR